MSLSALSFNDLNDIISLFSLHGSSADYGVQTDFVDEVQFEGFTPLEMMKTLKGLAGSITLAEFKQDLIMMVILCCERGANITRAVAAMSEAGKAKVDVLRARYNIKNRIEGNRRTCITLPRILQCVPWVACQYMVEAKRTVVEVTGLPRQMHCSSFGSIIPLSMDRGQLLILMDAYLVYLARFSATTSQRDPTRKTWTPQQHWRNSITFLIIQMTQSLLKDSQKATLLQRWGILKTTNLKSPEVSAGVLQVASSSPHQSCDEYIVIQ